MKQSNLEATFEFQLKAYKIKGWEPEFTFHRTRKWRIDFAFPELKLAVELDGATFANGRHNRGDGYAKDCEKYNELAIMGWRVMRFTTQMVDSGNAIDTLRRALDGKE